MTASLTGDVLPITRSQRAAALTYGTGRILLATADRGGGRSYGARDCLLSGAVATDWYWPVVRFPDHARELTFALSARLANNSFARTGAISATGQFLPLPIGTLLAFR